MLSISVSLVTSGGLGRHELLSATKWAGLDACNHFEILVELRRVNTG